MAAEYLEGMRLTERERAFLVDQLRKAGAADRRKQPRSIAEGSLVLMLTMEYPGGSSAHFKVYPWDLTRHGLAFFHRAYVYPGTRCAFTADTFDHQPISFAGEVVACAHVSGSVHTVGVKFEMDIDPEVFLGEQAAAMLAAQAPPPSPERAEDWLKTVGEIAAEIGRMAKEKSAPEPLRKRAMALVQHLSSVMGEGPGAASPEPAPAVAAAH
jgi:hypothetical protein